MAPLLAFVLMASVPAAPAPPVPQVSAIARAVAVILPVAINDGAGGEGAVHRRLARGNGAVWAVYE